MLGDRIGKAFSGPVEAVVRLFARVHPDILTITGLGLNGVACTLYALSGGRGYDRPDWLMY